MDMAHAFKTQTRKDFGLLYLGLIKAFEDQFFLNPQQIPIIAMGGEHAKSYAADVMFHHLLKGKDPMDLIDGEPANKMYLEEYPMQAAAQDCFADGAITSDEETHDVSLLFRNEPDMCVPANNCGGYRHYRVQEMMEAKALTARFKAHTKNKNGGLIFASSSAMECSSVRIYAHRMDDMWERRHTIEVNAPALKRSKKFRQGWEGLKVSYG